MKFEDMINNVILGDCYQVIKDIPDKSIDCIYVDVPYLYIQHGGCKEGIAKRSAKRELELLGLEQKDYDDTKGFENLRIARNKVRRDRNLQNQNLRDGFNYQEFIKEAFRVMKKCNMFIWCSRMQILDLMNEIHKYCDSTIDIMCWCKTNPIPTTNNNWLSDIEYCLYVRDKGVQLNSIYDCSSKWYVSPINQTDKSKFNHPTIKPLNFVERHIKNATKENDIVLDCFCGSGTTCVACKNTNRKYIGIEVNPKWHKVVVDRLNNIQANGQMTLFTM